MKYLIILFAVFSAINSAAQIEFKTAVSKDAVMIGEPFILDYEVNSNFENFKLPEFENFKVISGPNTSMQQSINMVNGEMIRKTTVKYTYYIKALTPGTHSVQPAEIHIDGDIYYSNTIDVIVIDSEYHDPNEHKGKDIKGTEKI